MGRPFDMSVGTFPFWSFAALLIWAPLPLGSNRPVPWTLLALITGLLLALWAMQAASRPARTLVAPERLWPAIAGFAVVALVVLIQVLPIMPRGWQHPIWIEAAGVLGDQVPGRISLDAAASGAALMRLLTYAGVFWLALQFSRQPRGARRIIQVIAFAGLGYAVYGLIVFVLDLQMILWWRNWTDLRGISSSFVNRNTYATYAGLGLICAVGLLITTVYRELRSRRRRRLSWGARLMRITWRGWWLVAAALALGFALILSQSRAGVASSAVALAVLVGCFGLTRLMRQRDVLITGSLAAALGVLVFVFGGDDLARRFERQGVDSSGRFETYERIVDAIGDSPWLGTGYGTFAAVYRSYQRGLSERYWNHAHDTYLENAFELGVPAAAALVGAIGWLAWRCGQRLERRRTSALYPCLGVAATTLVGLHSLLDFSLEIPAVAVTYAAIMGVAFGRARRSGGSHRRREVVAWHSGRGRRALGLAGAVAIGLLALAVPRMVAALVGLPVNLVERQLEASGMARLAELDRAIAAGGSAAVWADAGENRLRVAQAELALARRPQMSANARRAWFESAREALGESLTWGPANPAAWTQLAYAELALGGDPALIRGALELSLLTGPAEANLLVLRATLAAAAWDRLDGHDRARFRRQFAIAMRYAPQHFVEANQQAGRAELIRANLEPDLQRAFDRVQLLVDGP